MIFRVYCVVGARALARARERERDTTENTVANLPATPPYNTCDAPMQRQPLHASIAGLRRLSSARERKQEGEESTEEEGRRARKRDTGKPRPLAPF